ncbi:hypothetical protein [Martelella alba]|uniref:Uncharacterized protein n=1 Tax=Martelella alba TaxID=2590451 RepID=A0ABY2SPR1_9HYPH|nr:hypothetical protein [Martelella alba]TKI07850.1 hypothetical protein FCN80_05290 [Martelella alba]
MNRFTADALALTALLTLPGMSYAVSPVPAADDGGFSAEQKDAIGIIAGQYFVAHPAMLREILARIGEKPCPPHGTDAVRPRSCQADIPSGRHGGGNSRCQLSGRVVGAAAP